MLSTLPILDIVFIVLFALVYPVAGLIGYRRLQRDLQNGRDVNRSQLYRQTIIGQWILLLLGLGLWFGQNRSGASIGFTLGQGSMFFLGAGLALAVIVLLFFQLRQALRNTAEQNEELKQQFKPLAALLPQSKKDLHVFYLLSVTAGIVEEVIWRGMAIWYLAQFLPLWVAGLISALGFGMAHCYQGWNHVPKIVAVGVLFSAVYLLTASIWIPMVLHMAIDALQGRLAFQLMSVAPPSTASEPADQTDVRPD